MGIMVNVGSAGVTGQPVGLDGGPGGEIGGEEGVQAGGRVIGYLFEADAAGAGTTVLHFDGPDNEDFALAAAPPAADERTIFATAGKLGLVDLHQTGERAMYLDDQCCELVRRDL
jgi:hypothetical protein